ncbi:MAG: helix-turn-helix domain-containing protein [Prevotella sp.]|nr:helix-turn-helix domain-containing protein [Prevotella sp.]
MQYFTEYTRQTVGLLLAFLPLSPWAAGVESSDGSHQVCRMVRLDVEQLPSLNIPRAGHQVFYVNGEPTVAGGHTDGFVPTPTAEYYKDGEWHVMQMTYTHDFGLSVVLKSGKVLLAGGCEQPIGIGQTYTAEMYDPQTHGFRGFGNMCQKRVYGSALELDSGQVVIAGNWYHDDGIEIFKEGLSHNGDFNGKQSFIYIKSVEAQRSNPYIFRIAKDDALILGSLSTRGDTIMTSFADRLKGDTVHIPLFETWHPLLSTHHHGEASLIGHKGNEEFTYLLPVQDDTGRVAIARVCGTDISLLKTVSPIPMTGIDEQIEYGTSIIADRQAGRAYLLGISSTFHVDHDNMRFYVLCLDYAQASEDGTPLTLYYTDPMDIVPDYSPVLTPEGNLLIAGGLREGSNYTPSASAFLLRLDQAPKAASGGFGIWAWGLLTLVAIAIVWLMYWWLRRANDKSEGHVFDSGKDRNQTTSLPDSAADSALMERLTELMENERPYLKPDLKLSDLAVMLGTNSRYISDSIKNGRGCSFSQFINQYRVEHAKTLLRENPDIKLSTVCTESGFSGESSFFRSFKAMTGTTPKEWILQKDC